MDALVSRLHPPTTGTSLPDYAPGLEKAFPSSFEESSGPVRCVAGELPDWLRGTCYLNGPARFQVGDLTYGHWLDGDGMVSALHFGDDELHFRCRYIRSTKSVTEQAAGRAIYRTFGTSFPASRLNNIGTGLENPVNVSAYPYAGRLLAFGEQGLPWELDPRTLETRGPFHFQGRLNEASPLSAHPKIDPGTGEMFNFGVFFSARSPRLYFYCFAANTLRYRTSVPLPYACSVHDFALSPSYAVVFLSPYLLDISSFLHEGRSVMEALHWEPERGSLLMILDRATGGLVATLPAGHGYCLHLVHAFEEGGRLLVDLLEFDSPVYSHYQPIPQLLLQAPVAQLVRYIVDPAARQLLDRIPLHSLQTADFPAIDPRMAAQRADDLWVLNASRGGSPGRKFFDQLVHRHSGSRPGSDIYHCPPQCYLGGEPVFVGEPGSKSGVVLCPEFHAGTETTDFLVFDAMRVSGGPIARVALDRPLYLGFHAVFDPSIQAS